MTQEEFEKKYAEMASKINSSIVKVQDLNKMLSVETACVKKEQESLCNLVYNEKFGQYADKPVTVRYYTHWGKNPDGSRLETKVDGFICGVECWLWDEVGESEKINTGLIISMCKMKKDKTKSQLSWGHYDMPRLCDIISIEEL